MHTGCSIRNCGIVFILYVFRQLWPGLSLQYSKSSNSIHFCPKNTLCYSKLCYLNLYYRMGVKIRAIARNRAILLVTSNTLGPKS